MAGAFENLNQAGWLALLLQPEWTDQDAAAADYTDAPSSATDGVSVLDAPRAGVLVALRENAAFRTSRVEITAADAATTYTISINGTAVNVTGLSTLSTIASGLVTAIAGNPTVDALVTATVDPDDGTGATVLITGKSDANYYIDASVSGGTGTLSFSADAVTCTVDVWASPGGLIRSSSTGYENGWVRARGRDHDALTYSLDYGGLIDIVDCGPYRQLYLELSSIAGHGSDGGSITLTIGRVAIGPGVLAASS